MNKISVIVPVYNVDLYLEECLDSLVNQTYKNLEIILIDDGSTDKSGIICDNYAKNDKRIKVIHQNNHGSAYAKNIGLRLATGEFLAFLDSDDYLQIDAYEYMLRNILECQADIIQCKFNYIYTNLKKENNNFTKVQKLDNIQYLRLYTSDWTCGILWDKLYKRKLFKNIYFEEGHKIDDEFFTYLGVMNAKRIIRIPYFIYNYRQRLSSVMSSSDTQVQIIDDTLDYLTIRRKNICKSFPQLKEEFDNHYLNMLIILSKKEYITKELLHKIKLYIYKYMKEKNKTKVSLDIKIKILEIELCPINFLFKKKNPYGKESSPKNEYFR